MGSCGSGFLWQLVQQEAKKRTYAFKPPNEYHNLSDVLFVYRREDTDKRKEKTFCKKLNVGGGSRTNGNGV